MSAPCNELVGGVNPVRQESPAVAHRSQYIHTMHDKQERLLAVADIAFARALLCMRTLLNRE